MKNLLFALCVVVCACTSLDKTASVEREVMDSWKGQTKASLLQVWGAPSKVTSDGQGGEILVFDDPTVFPQMGQVYANPVNRSAYYTTQPNVVTRSRMFYVNKDGIIYSWLCQGRQGY